MRLYLDSNLLPQLYKYFLIFGMVLNLVDITVDEVIKTYVVWNLVMTIADLWAGVHYR